MKEGYRLLGDFIRQVDVRNTDGKEENLLGVSVQKMFIPSIANTVGTDFTKYKVVKRGQFTYIPDTSRRGDKIGIALLTDYDEGLVSNIYTVFEVKDENELLPEYLMLWFSRPEFDRYARFKSHGSVREIMDWDEMCKVELPVPSIEKQRSIVKAYNTITDRIELKRKINDNLEATAQAVFQDQFASYYGCDKLPEGYSIVSLDSLCTVKGGKRLPADCELLDDPTEHPYIRVRDVGGSRYVCLTDQFQYIDEETHQAISRYIVNTGDIVISIVGTIGLLGKIHSSLDKANLTENCVKLAGIHTVTSDYLYYTLCYKKQIKEIDLLTVGAVQAKLPMYNIQSMKILVPPTKVISDFQKKMNALDEQIEANTMEIQKLNELRSVLLAKLSD
ncbi:restriction endonuclease subunit S [Clostridiaceae bacterium NSJ-31]|uniref:Restriction endonuclease subunit S n=1 Tax=Ligaoa zhengdingensis TaxID=2763658 RepID=A0A926DYH4_9FIRM|nr:restriction endonuclease subunit S [Ligaoa zhengdingensis]MBC8547778.1 restriction endonuclease subunit S [Ligaoa zhengdingensis]